MFLTQKPGLTAFYHFSDEIKNKLSMLKYRYLFLPARRYARAGNRDRNVRLSVCLTLDDLELL